MVQICSRNSYSAPCRARCAGGGESGEGKLLHAYGAHARLRPRIPVAAERAVLQPGGWVGQQNNSPKVFPQVPPPSSVISDVSWMCTGVVHSISNVGGGRGVARARTRHHFNPAQRFNSHASSLQPGSAIPLSAGGTFLKRRKCVPHGTSNLYWKI